MIHNYPLANYAHATLTLNNVKTLIIFKQSEQSSGDKFTNVVVKTLGQFPNAQSTPSFPYHIHDKSVDTTGDCDSTGPHFDPHHVNSGGSTKKYNCIMKHPSTCEVGDLSGKHNKLSGQKGEISYVDNTLPTMDVLLRKSVVIHASDGTTKRLACANIVLGRP